MHRHETKEGCLGVCHVGKTGYVAVVLGTFGDNADLEAIPEGIIAIDGIGIRLVPWDQIRIGSPIGFPATKSFQYLWIAFFARAQVDMRPFKTLSATLGYLIQFAQD